MHHQFSLPLFLFWPFSEWDTHSYDRRTNAMYVHKTLGIQTFQMLQRTCFQTFSKECFCRFSLFHMTFAILSAGEYKTLKHIVVQNFVTKKSLSDCKPFSFQNQIFLHVFSNVSIIILSKNHFVNLFKYTQLQQAKMHFVNCIRQTQAMAILL